MKRLFDSKGVALYRNSHVQAAEAKRVEAAIQKPIAIARPKPPAKDKKLKVVRKTQATITHAKTRPDYSRQRADNLCHDCRKPTQGKSRCGECAVRRAICATKKIQTARDAGRCIWSGCPEPSLSTSQYCEPHRQRKNAVRRNKRQRRPEHGSVV